MPQWMVLLILLALAAFAFINFLTVRSVQRLSRGRELLTLVDDPGRAFLAPELAEWARSRNFELDTQFDFAGIVGTDQPVEVNVWSSPDRTCLFIHYHFQDRDWYEFGSSLEGTYGLTTSAMRETLMLPQPPEQLIQVFTGLDPEALWQRHQETLALFQERVGAAPGAADRPVEEIFLETLDRQVTFVRSLPLWQLRGAWWYLARPRLMANRPIARVLEDLPR